MNTILKINVLTDDPSLPNELREKVTELLRDVIKDDPDGVDRARVSLEWKHTVQPPGYMQTLAPTPKQERIKLPLSAVARPRTVARKKR